MLRGSSNVTSSTGFGDPTQRNKTLQVKRSHTKAAGDDLLKQRVQSIILDSADDFNEIYKRHRHRHVDVERTLWDLIGHVSFDSDGGVLNIHNWNSKNKQHSKVEQLRRSHSRILQSILGCFRLGVILLNSLGIIFLTIRVVYRYYHGINGPEASLAITKRIPLVEMIVGVKLVEVIFVSWSILRICWELSVIQFPSYLERYENTHDIAMQASLSTHSRQSSRQSGRSESSMDARPSMVETNVKMYTLPKYKRVATIFGELLPRLQGFSALQIFQFAYPGLLVKTMHMFTPTQTAARLVAERFMKVDENTASDEELADHLLRQLLLLQYGPNLLDHESACELFFRKYSEWSLNGLVWMLIKTASTHHNQESSDSVDWTALNCRCRLRLVWFVEDACKFGFTVFCFVAAFTTLFTKLCIFASLIMEKHPHYWTILGYFLLFLNQVINMLDVEMWLMWRVSAFVFGGRDAIVSSEEAYIMRTYKAILCERVWHSTKSKFERFRIMMNLDDNSLQRLIIEEDAVRKQELILNLRHHTKDIERDTGDKLLQCLLGGSMQKVPGWDEHEYAKMPPVDSDPINSGGLAYHVIHRRGARQIVYM